MDEPCEQHCSLRTTHCRAAVPLHSREEKRAASIAQRMRGSFLSPRATPLCSAPSGITVRGCARGCMVRMVLLRASRQQQWSSVICEEAVTLNSALERATRETESAMHSGRTKGAHHTALERGEQKR